MNDDRYGQDALRPGWREVGRKVIPTHDAVRDLVVEEVATGFCGAIVRLEKQIVTLEDRHGALRLFPLGSAFLIDGEPVRLVVPARAAQQRARTASGSLAMAATRARVARGSRIFVEGRHDAELVEKVWGADLRIEGVVVEYLEGVDNLEELLTEFGPGPGRKVGVLVDHLVPGSKESRIAENVARGPHGRSVLVVGHPYVDVWQAVKPERLGMKDWPTTPRTVEWKHGICEHLGWPHEDQADIARAWQRILGRVRSYADLEAAFLGRVEQLIDFATVD
ncbi:MULTISPECIES: DUF3097 domain-containing protein [unclassified Cryobacterium]|uniref:DUF3097 domain-containing protein n=1 Tax=unclassified Cryobacterium TaxID=2649013 RepID=UPI00106A31F5|nr:MULTISPECIES: DUF3097 domain-containing protein [unclassified Cryobacterium]TFC00351.1 DUF3097 domain-containing protein [Cryobacterium sp. MDB2-A-1]TFC10146.1 DUF3097 domain-containing protein [Cryobacterium sp. MDB2-33-2]TFC13406.1 DUF3097 domain-containing protein [Cryobacterium sp. MDB2-10]TFC14215.1 DUF3097 domain-containing protein [Cryobacterium sp. MDB2-A-2]